MHPASEHRGDPPCFLHLPRIPPFKYVTNDLHPASEHRGRPPCEPHLPRIPPSMYATGVVHPASEHRGDPPRVPHLVPVTPSLYTTGVVHPASEQIGVPMVSHRIPSSVYSVVFGSERVFSQSPLLRLPISVMRLSDVRLHKNLGHTTRRNFQM
jgi:hypothetical protein